MTFLATANMCPIAPWTSWDRQKAPWTICVSLKKRNYNYVDKTERKLTASVCCRHVGVCCPDDIVLSNLAGSNILMDLPAGGQDYDEANGDSTTGW